MKNYFICLTAEGDRRCNENGEVEVFASRENADARAIELAMCAPGEPVLIMKAVGSAIAKVSEPSIEDYS